MNMSTEELREGEEVAKISKEQVAEIRDLVHEDAALRALFDEIIHKKKELGKRINAFWEKIGKEYLVDIGKCYHVNYETGALKKGPVPKKET